MSDTMIHKKTRWLAALLLVAFGTAGCASTSSTRVEEGAVIGGSAGAVIGAVIGNKTGSTAKGAIIGAAVGGAAGAIIGSQMDEQADELEDELEGAKIERVAEGIQITFDSGILFGFDSDRLLPEARANLTRLVESLRDFPDTEVLVVGHTDAIGSESYNQRLSERRAQSAANYLANLGVSNARIEMKGLGEIEPVSDNETEDGRALNRRVEVAIFASDAYVEELQRRNR